MGARPAQRLELLIVATIYTALARPCVALTPCEEALFQVVNRSDGELSRLVLASGKSPPFDAGKYELCLSDTQNEYFLLTLTATDLDAGDQADVQHGVPMELGLCAPAACAADSIQGLADSPLLRRLLPALTGFSLESAKVTAPRREAQQPGVGCALAGCVVGVFALLVFVASGSGAQRRPPLSTLEVDAPAAASGPSPPSCRDDRGAREDLSVELLSSAAEVTPAAAVVTATSARSLSRPLGSACRGMQRFATLLGAFSLTGEKGTISKLMEVPPSKPTDCLNGLRVLSMIWIILGHTFLMPTAIAGYSNLEDVVTTSLNENAAEGNPFMFIILSAQSGVDTFFFLSGFLLAWVTLQDSPPKKCTMQICQGVVMRYVRLTPSLAFTMLVYYQIWPYLASGPFAARFQDSIFRRCRDSWWSELVYTMNFVPFDSDKVCMGWTWYLGDDMIFFIISLPIIFAYNGGRKLLGWSILALLTVSSLGITAWLILHHHLSVYIFDDHYKDYSYWAYSKPYTRAPAYFVGVGTAWLIDVLDRGGQTRDELPPSRTRASHPWAASAAAAGAAGLLLFLVFIPVTDFGPRKNTWGDIASVLYLDFGRMLWAACWAILTMLCYYDRIPLVNGFLSHRWWTPLARLTYGAYLLHPLVIKLAAGSARHYYTFSAMDMFCRHLGNVSCAYGGALLLWALVERPTMTLTSAVRKRQPAGKPQTPGRESMEPSPSGVTGTEECGSRGSRTPDRAAG